MKSIPVAGPSITQKEIGYVTDAVTNAWYEKANMYHEKFEQAFQNYIGSEYSIALPSCTSALHLSLLAIGIGPGDEVIVPDCTWIATAAPIFYVGATPVFADIDKNTWCLSEESLQECITSHTKAVIPVDLYGGMPDYRAISEIAHDHDMVVIEDAAEAIGSEYNGKKAGSFGLTGCFSFHGSKTLTTGEGGMLVTEDKAVYDRAQFLRDHGRIPGDVSFRNREVGYKYKMSSMQAALGLAQLERVNELVDRKREIFGWYREELGNIQGIQLNAELNGVKNSYWMSSVVFDPSLQCPKEKILKAFGEAGIGCRPFFSPLSSLPAYEGTILARMAAERNKNAYAIGPYGINLPCSMRLTREEAGYVSEILRGVIGIV